MTATDTITRIDAPAKPALHLDDMIVTVTGHIAYSGDEDPDTGDAPFRDQTINRKLAIVFDHVRHTCRLVAIDPDVRDRNFPYDGQEPGEITLTDPVAVAALHQLAVLLSTPGSFTPAINLKRGK